MIILQIVSVEGYSIRLLEVLCRDQNLIIKPILSQKVPIKFAIKVPLLTTFHLIIQFII